MGSLFSLGIGSISLVCVPNVDIGNEGNAYIGSDGVRLPNSTSSRDCEITPKMPKPKDLHSQIKKAIKLTKTKKAANIHSLPHFNLPRTHFLLQ